MIISCNITWKKSILKFRSNLNNIMYNFLHDILCSFLRKEPCKWDCLVVLNDKIGNIRVVGSRARIVILIYHLNDCSTSGRKVENNLRRY